MGSRNHYAAQAGALKGEVELPAPAITKKPKKKINAGGELGKKKKSRARRERKKKAEGGLLRKRGPNGYDLQS